MKNYIPKWKKIPRSVRKEYEGGMTVFDLSIKHKADPVSMRKALIHFGTKIRPPGTKLGMHHNRKLSDQDIKQILEFDDNNVPHAAIARFFSKGDRTISRERVRQICVQSGHIPRRMKIVPRAERIRARRIARDKSRLEIAHKASKAWKEGAGRDELSYIMFGEIKSRWHINSRLGFLRDKYGIRMFPYRIKEHWTTLSLEQREKRIRRISDVWNVTGSIIEVKRQCGFKNYNSASAAIHRYRRSWPHLFPHKTEIMQKRMQ